MLVVVTASPSAATRATIVTTTPLREHEQSIRTALQAAVEAAVTGAVQVLARDSDPGAGTGVKAPGPDSEWDAADDQPSESE